jgi:hypothetical protein
MVDRLKKAYPDRDIKISINIASWDTDPFSLYISSPPNDLNKTDFIIEFLYKLTDLEKRVEELITTNPFKEDKEK